MWHCTLGCLHILLTHNGQYVALCSRLLIHIVDPQRTVCGIVLSAAHTYFADPQRTICGIVLSVAHTYFVDPQQTKSLLLIHILLTLLFLYCALEACIRCKRLTNTLLHYITTAVTLVTRRKQGLTLRSNSWSCGAPQLQTACWCSAVAEVLLLARAATRRRPPVMWNCWRTGLTWEAPASETICT